MCCILVYTALTFKVICVTRLFKSGGSSCALTSVSSDTYIYVILDRKYHQDCVYKLVLLSCFKQTRANFGIVLIANPNIVFFFLPNQILTLLPPQYFQFRSITLMNIFSKSPMSTKTHLLLQLHLLSAMFRWDKDLPFSTGVS